MGHPLRSREDKGLRSKPYANYQGNLLGAYPQVVNYEVVMAGGWCQYLESC